jgi:HEPN domain-containing protein
VGNYTYRRGFILPDYEYLKRVPDKLDDIESIIVEFLIHTFLDAADEDYITARLLFINSFHRAYYWSAQQCLEKILKLLILIFGGSTLNKKGNNTHNLKLLLDEFSKYYELESIDIYKGINDEILSLSSVKKPYNLESFFEKISTGGDTDGRYGTVDTLSDFIDIVILDSTYHKLRSIFTDSHLASRLRHASIEVGEMINNNNLFFHVDTSKMLCANPFQAQHGHSYNSHLKLMSSKSDNHRIALQWLVAKKVVRNT